MLPSVERSGSISESPLWGEERMTHSPTDLQTHGHQQRDMARRSWAEGTSDKTGQKKLYSSTLGFLAAGSIYTHSTGACHKADSMQADSFPPVSAMSTQGTVTGTTTQSHSMVMFLWILHCTVTLPEHLQEAL